jgi:hypothetical protein
VVAVAPDRVRAVVGGLVGRRGRVVPDDAVGAGDGRQLAAGVDLVDHDLEVEALARLRVGGAGDVAGGAVLDGQAVAAVAVELVAVAGLARGGLHDVAALAGG